MYYDKIEVLPENMSFTEQVCDYNFVARKNLKSQNHATEKLYLIE